MVLDNTDPSSQFMEMVGSPVQEQISLSDFSHFRIGGRADYFYSADSVSDLSAAIHWAQICHIPFYIIGGGYNILFSDKGFRGLILKNSVQGCTRPEKHILEIYSGTPLHELLQFCRDSGLGGLEFMSGIPGTMGGAVYGNAGAFDRDIGSQLREAIIFDLELIEKRVDQEYFDFSYRFSRLKTKHDILLKVSLEVVETDKAKLEKTISEILEKRKKNHPPWDTACAGSYFKNPVLPDGNKVPAAKLLEKVGAKGLRVGDAVVYTSHANFIINEGKATAQDVLDLASILKGKVREEFGVELEEEVIYLPEVVSIL